MSLGSLSIGPLLEPDEHVVWAGRSGTHLFLSRRQGAALAFNILWWLIILSAATSLWGFRDSPLVLVVGLIFAIGALQDSWRTGRWLLRRWGERYVLTDQRVLVIGRSGEIVAHASLLNAHLFRLVTAPGLRGTILLDKDEPLFQTGSRLDLKPERDAARLSGVEGADALFALIQKTAAEREVEWTASAGG